MNNTLGKRIIGMSEITAKLTLLNILELITEFGSCVNSNGKDCPAAPYCSPGNPCAHAWLDATIQKEM